MHRFAFGLILSMPLVAAAQPDTATRRDGVFPMSADELEGRFTTVLTYWCRDSRARYRIDSAECTTAVEASVPRCRAQAPFPDALYSWGEFEAIARDFYRCAEPARKAEG